MLELQPGLFLAAIAFCTGESALAGITSRDMPLDRSWDVAWIPGSTVALSSLFLREIPRLDQMIEGCFEDGFKIAVRVLVLE